MSARNKLLIAIVSGSVLGGGLVTAAHAGPQLFDGARAFAMAGTGVAAGLPGNASFVNPALLSLRQLDESNDFALVLPSVSARYADDQKVYDQIDDIQNEIDTFNAAVNAGNQAQVQTSAATLENQLIKINKDTTRGDLGLGLALAVPGEKVGFSAFSDASLRASARATVAQSDLDYLDAIATAGSTDVINTGGNTPGAYSLESSGSLVAAAVAEAGVSVATQFDVQGNRLAVGLSPKYVQIRTFDYTKNVANFDNNDFHASDYETRKSGFNMDLGTAYQFGQADQWIAGLSVRNLVPMKLDSVNGLTYHLDPKVTAGIAHHSEWHTLTFDLDLNKNRAFGYDDATQWAAVGAEFDLLDTLQLRAGIRQNLANTHADSGVEEKTQYTAGLGLSPFGVQVMLSALYSNSEYGAAAELGVAF